MLALLWLGACQFVVDLDPEGPPVDPVEADDTAIPPPLGDGPGIIVGTSCGGNAPPEPGADAPPIDFGYPIAPPWAFEPAAVTGLQFILSGEATRVRVTDGPQLTLDYDGPTGIGEGPTVFLADGIVLVLSSCKSGACTPGTLTIGVPEPRQFLGGLSFAGGVDIEGTVARDVDVMTLLDDLTVRGSVRGLRAGSQEGDVTVEVEDTEVLEVYATTGALDVSGDVSGEVCIEGGSGGTEVALSRARDVYLNTSVGDLTARLDDRPSLVDLGSAQGALSLTVPAGPYALELIVGSGEPSVIGIEDDPDADATLRVVSSSGVVTLTGE